jgi:hypothetical protein
MDEKLGQKNDKHIFSKNSFFTVVFLQKFHSPQKQSGQECNHAHSFTYLMFPPPSAVAAAVRVRTFVAQRTDRNSTCFRRLQLLFHEHVRLSFLLQRCLRSIAARLSWPAAYGLVLGASAALNTVYVLYSLELFTSSSVARLTPAWFYLGQTLYM